MLERIPPWGDPDLKSYSKKFHDVLDSLEKYPDFRIDFEISARELEDALAVDPSVVERMRGMLARGKLGFVGGDHPSPTATSTAPSCLRQIQYGLAVFRRLFDYSVNVFFHQETGLHDQLPQILCAMGYTVAVPPRFPYVLEFTGGGSPELTSHYGVLEFVNDADFTYWEGLDGTRIPLYLSMPAPASQTRSSRSSRPTATRTCARRSSRASPRSSSSWSARGRRTPSRSRRSSSRIPT